MKKPHHNKTPRATEELIVKLRKQSASYDEIRDEIGVSHQTIAKVARAYGVLGLKSGNEKTPRATEERIVQLRKQGISYSKIRDETGASLRAIARIVIAHGIPTLKLEKDPRSSSRTSPRRRFSRGQSWCESSHSRRNAGKPCRVAAIRRSDELHQPL